MGGAFPDQRGKGSGGPQYSDNSGLKIISPRFEHEETSLRHNCVWMGGSGRRDLLHALLVLPQRHHVHLYSFLLLLLRNTFLLQLQALCLPLPQARLERIQLRFLLGLLCVQVVTKSLQRVNGLFRRSQRL